MGFVVMQAWKILHGLPIVDPQVACMCACREGIRKCSRQVVFLEHRVVAAARLSSAFELPTAWLGKTCIDEHLVRNVVVDIPVYVHTEGMVIGPLDWAALNRRWAHLVEEEHSTNWFSWPLWLPLAELLVCRKWPVDVTTVVLRNTTRSWKPPLLPPRSLLLSMLRSVQPQEPYRWQQHATAAKPFFQSSTMSTVAPAYDSRHLYDSRQVVAVLRASRHCRSLKEAVKPETISDLGLLVSAHFGRQEVLSLGQGQGQGWKVPGEKVIRFARRRLDVCAMLAHRVLSKSVLAFHYLAFDASPQRSGREVFCTYEHVIARNAVSASEHIRPEDVVVRKLPISALGQGRFSLADKVACLVHQIWLDYGPTEADVCQFCLSVRQCLSDMGTEHGICNYRNVVSDVLLGKEDTHPPGHGIDNLQGPQCCPGEGPAEFLFPLALQVPGSQHIIDWVLRRAVMSFQWFPAWNALAKLLLHFVRSVNQRERLQAFITDHTADSAASALLNKSLSAAGIRFANWRWQTLRKVTQTLLRMQKALCFVAGSPNGQALFESRDDNGKELVAIICSDLFWCQTNALATVIYHLTDFSSWVKGCHCHEDDLRAGKKVVCNLKGCRAKEFAGKLAQVLSAMDSVRRNLPDFGPVGGQEVSFAITMAMSDLQTKFHWVDELPYLIWHVRASDGHAFSAHNVSALAR